jgi:hypothetical protein
MLHLYIRKISREKMGEGRRRVVGHYIFVECIAIAAGSFIFSFTL